MTYNHFGSVVYQMNHLSVSNPVVQRMHYNIILAFSFCTGSFVQLAAFDHSLVMVFR